MKWIKYLIILLLLIFSVLLVLPRLGKTRKNIEVPSVPAKHEFNAEQSFSLSFDIRMREANYAAAFDMLLLYIKRNPLRAKSAVVKNKIKILEGELEKLPELDLSKKLVLGRTYAIDLRMKDSIKALNDYYSKTLQDKEGNASYEMSLNDVYEYGGQDALREGIRLAQTGTMDERFINKTASHLMHLGRNKEAEMILEKTIPQKDKKYDLDNASFTMLNNLAWATSQSGDYEQSINICEKGIQKYPESRAVFYAVWGRDVFLKENRSKVALDHALGILEDGLGSIKPGENIRYGQIYLQMEEVYYLSGNHQKAYETLLAFEKYNNGLPDYMKARKKRYELLLMDDAKQ